MSTPPSPSKICHRCQYKTAVLDVNRELPPLPAEAQRKRHSSSQSTMFSANQLERSSTAPSFPSYVKTQSSASIESDESKDSFRLVARQLLDSLQPAPLQIPLRHTERKLPDLVDPAKSDIMSTASQEVPIMLSDNSSVFDNPPPGNPFNDDTGIWEVSISTDLGASSSYTSYDACNALRICSCRSESDIAVSQRHLPHSMSEGHIANHQVSQNQHDDECACQHENRHVHFDVSKQAGTYYRHSDPSDHQPSSPTRGRSPERVSGSKNALVDYDADDGDIDIFHKSPQKGSRSPHKRLFGPNGWLGRTPNPNERYRKTGLKKMGERIKQVGDWVTGDPVKVPPKESREESCSPPKIVTKPKLCISLDPPSQARLYSEVEVMICVTANKFLLQQLYSHRMSAESVKKIANFWESKNRAQVAEFQFDQGTQRELVLQNIRTFQFHGECAINPVALKSTLDNWKAVAKEMSVRTFCYPDSVIRKHLHDTHKVLEMMGAPDATLRSFEGLQMRILAMMTEHRRKTSEPSNLPVSPPLRISVEQQINSLNKR